MPETYPHIDLALITANPALAGCAELAGIDRIFIDLETLGKHERQAGKGLFLSTHRPEDIATLSEVVAQKRLMVRLNALHPGTAEEIAYALRYGVGTLMLPMFTQAEDVETFIRLVGGKARVSLLLENKHALANIDSVVEVPGIDEIHVGLNDLALSLGLKQWFDVLGTSILEDLSHRITGKGLRFGFGGVTSPSATHLPIPPACVIGEQVRLNSSMALLGRSFRTMFETQLSMVDLLESVEAIRSCIAQWQIAAPAAFTENQRQLISAIQTFHESKSTAEMA